MAGGGAGWSARQRGGRRGALDSRADRECAGSSRRTGSDRCTGSGRSAGSDRRARSGRRARPGRRTGSGCRARPGRRGSVVRRAGCDSVRAQPGRAQRRRPGRRIRAIDPRAAAAQHLGNPFYAVRYAHAHAASILRWSADLGLPAADAAQFQPRLLAHPREQALLDAMSWLPERVAGAARRGQPHVLAGYLEELSGTYLDWQECCSLSQPGAFPPGPDQPPGPDRPPRPDKPPGSSSRPDRTRQPGQASRSGRPG